MTKKFILIYLIIFSFCIACATTNKASNEVSEKVFSVTYDNATDIVSDNETLILYYSKMGSTKKVANKIHALIPDAKLVEIASGIGLMKAAFWLQPFSLNAKIEIIDVDSDQYKQIILCSPIWFQKIASPARTVINTMPFKDKQMHLFITCGGHFGKGGQKKTKKLVESKEINLMSLSIIKTGDKSEDEINSQTQEALSNVLPNQKAAS